MKTVALAFSLFLAAPVCYHAETLSGGLHAVGTDEGPMTRRALLLSMGLTGATLGLSGQVGKLETRPVEARLTGNALYVPCRVLEGDTGLIHDVTCDYPRSSGKVRLDSLPPLPTRGSAGSPSREPSQLTLGDVLTSGKVDVLSGLINRYEEWTSTHPQDAGSWSDLAASYLQRGQLANDPRDLVRAYGAADRAIRADPSLPEPRFNRAVALEYLYLPDAAQEAWADYLEHDTTGGWADEARTRLQEAGSRVKAVSLWRDRKEELKEAALADQDAEVNAIVDRFRQAAREYAEQELFGDWGKAVLASKNEEAANHLKILRKIGEALAGTSGDSLVLDSVVAIDEASTEPDRSRLVLIARGAQDFQEGFQHYRVRESKQAAQQLSMASQALQKGRCELAWRADFYQVSNKYISRSYQETVKGAVALRQRMDIAKVSYPALRAHLYWVKGMAEATYGQTAESVADLQRSLRLFENLEEFENVANLYCRIGDVLMSRGQRREGWANIYRALRTTPVVRDPDKVSAAYMMAGNAALQDQFVATALVFQKEWVRQARLDSENTVALIEALTGLARLQNRVGADEDAQVSLQEAKGWALRVKRPELQGDLRLTQGLLLEKTEPAKAIDYLTSALPSYQESAIFSLLIYQTRGRAYRHLGRTDLAEADFESALKIYGDMGARLEKVEDLRLALLQETDEVFDEMVGLKAEQEERAASLAYADRARTRVLPGVASKLWTGLESETQRLLESEPEPLSLDQIRQGLPEGVTLIQYSVLPDRTLIWTLRRSGEKEQFLVVRISRDEVAALATHSRFFETPEGRRASKTLFDKLIAPCLSSVPKEERLVIVPDKALHWVAFPALLDSSGRYLFESHPVQVTPSATIYVSLLDRHSGRGSTDKSHGLIVGNPAFDHLDPSYATLQSLNAANEEAWSLRRQSGAPLLDRDKATKTAFLSAAPKAEWIQFSGHALIDPANTLLSKLVFASSPIDNGALTAREIYSLDLKRTNLVVLAACDTGNEYVAGGEGVTSLARAFLAAGVPTVVASLWSVDDEATAHLFKFFHEEWRPGVDPVNALRKSQLKMLATEKFKSPKAWAAFEVIGASAGGTH